MFEFEHIGRNVPDALAVGAWYAQHMRMNIVLEGVSGGTVPVCFLADETGRIILEFYTNAEYDIPDPAPVHPMVFHVAFKVSDAAAERDRLVAAGATFFNETRLANGSLIVFLRDPWHMTIQLCERTHPIGQSK
jgi:catechol 2,3-dioxygenase-like lactoylglutathione lyase family enzyme